LNSKKTEEKYFQKDYQKLEFFGDSVLDLFLVANCYYFLVKVLKKTGFHENNLHNIKIFLTNNQIFGKLALLSNLHVFAQNLDSSIVF